MAQHNIRVIAEKRDEPDLRRLARALIDLAIAQSEAELADEAELATDECGETAEPRAA